MFGLCSFLCLCQEQLYTIAGYQKLVQTFQSKLKTNVVNCEWKRTHLEHSMTLPDERYRAVMNTRMFLLELCDPKSTPGVPKSVRETARWCLRHYPDSWEMKQASESSPHVFQEKMEDLHKFLLKGKEIKDENRT